VLLHSQVGGLRAAKTVVGFELSVEIAAMPCSVEGSVARSL